MATSIVVQGPEQAGQPETFLQRVLRPGLLTAGLTAATLAIHGYHPYAEDGGIYVAWVKYLLDRSLYPGSLPFVSGHLRYSVFGATVAWLVSGTGLRLESVLLLIYIATVWATLAAAWALATRAFERTEARVGAVSLLAVWITMPVAGTSLLLTDPYVTARSFSTPLTLVALVAVAGAGRKFHEGGGRARPSLVLCAVVLLLAGVMHPLMAAYGAGCVLVLAWLLSADRRVRIWGTLALCSVAFALAAAIWVQPTVESAAYHRVVATRTYWFLGRWQWFELFGLAAPVLILSAIAMLGRACTETLRALAGMSVVCGLTAVAIALLFVREGTGSDAVAMLQPLRIFQTVYAVMILSLGGLLGEMVLRRRLWLWALCFTVLGGIMLRVEQRTFPSSPHLEVGGELQGRLASSRLSRVLARSQANEWETAFRWIREHTPKDAVFALPLDYVKEPGEDAQGFRAIAERSALADFSKDGGEAAITPRLAALWARDQDALIGLDRATDAVRVARLRPLGAMWIVLPVRESTALPCPYRNAAVQVCRLP